MSSPVGSILDLKAEIASKKSFQPDAETQEYTSALMAEYTWDQSQFHRPLRAFNDRSFLGYMTLAKDDTFKYVIPPVDPNDWRNFIRSGEERNKLDGLLAFLLDLNFGCEPSARDFTGEVNDDMGSFAGAFIKHLKILDESEVKDPLSDLSMFSIGTLYKRVVFTRREGVAKIGADWNPMSDKPYSYSTRDFEEFAGVETTVWKPNRVFLGDISQPMMEKQPHIWYEMVVPYATAYKLFHGWKNWKYVSPQNASTDQWTDVLTDTETEDGTSTDKVRIRFRESTVTNEFTIFCNRVLMTPIGLALPDGEYSFIMQQAAMLDPHLAYGRSFMDNVRPYVAVKDVLTSVLVDKSRQLLEPPMKSRFRSMVNRYMCKPGSVTQMQGEGDLSLLIPESAMQDFVFEAIKVYESMADKASISPVFQGQQTKGQMTKFEVEQMLTQSIRAVAGMAGAAEAWRRQEARKMFRLGLNHFSEITGFEFEADEKNVKFGKLPATQKAHLAMVREMRLAENLALKRGNKRKMMMVDPDRAKDYSVVFKFRVNPQQRDSETADEGQVMKKIEAFRNAPTVDQAVVDKFLVKKLGESEDEFIKKQEPGSPAAGVPSQGLQTETAPPLGAQALPPAALPT